MIKKTHTRNQRRMYRIHKQEEQIEKDKIIIAEQQIELDKYKEVIDKAIEYINEMCLCSDGYCDYGDDLNSEHIIDI